MAFKIQANPTFKINVAIPTPGEKAQILSVTFRHKRKKEVTSWLAAANAAGLSQLFGLAGQVRTRPHAGAP